MPTPDEIAARQAIKKLEQDAKHNPPPGGDPTADAQTREDGLDDPVHQAPGQVKQDARWLELPNGEGWSHPDHDKED